MTVGSNGWKLRLNVYKIPDDSRAIFELMVTVLSLVALWVTMWVMAGVSAWLPALLAIPSGALLVRLFMIQHDCGHNAFFSSRQANDWTGRILGVFTLTPFDFWRHSHALHHAGSGNLDRRGIGDIDTLTVEEYLARSRWGRLKYRMYRHPLVMFGLGPSFLFLLLHRLPLGATRLGPMPWLSTMLTNLGIAALFTLIIALMGLATFLLLYLPMTVIGASIGVWLFYVQHQFEHTYWEQDTDWSHPDAALHGSSFYDLPRWLMWLTGNIGIHHLHHLSSRIPFYRLPEALADYPELRGIGRLTLWQSLANVRLTLWDKARHRMISFSALKQRPA
ncbi:MAG: fatty acid desaturase [Aestuariivirga sp.]|uniref:fatty acid desaturase n=1 Tax=Aestuariivirga sp. TaxID=2650926 RepID=UPI00301B0754